MIPRPPRSPLFPYTTLFRSSVRSARPRRARQRAAGLPARLRRHRRRAVDLRGPVHLLRAPGHDRGDDPGPVAARSEEHTSELQSQSNLVCRLLLEKKKQTPTRNGVGALLARLENMIQTGNDTDLISLVAPKFPADDLYRFIAYLFGPSTRRALLDV